MPYQRDLNEHPPPILKITLRKRGKGQEDESETINRQSPATQTPPAGAPTPALIPRIWTWILVTARSPKAQRAVIAALPLLAFLFWFAAHWRGRRLLLRKRQSTDQPHLDRIIVKGAA